MFRNYIQVGLEALQNYRPMGEAIRSLTTLSVD